MPDLHCSACGYNLSGLKEHVCPECGVAFDPVALEKTRKESITLRMVLLKLLGAPALLALMPLFVLRVNLVALLMVLVYMLLLIVMGSKDLAGKYVLSRRLIGGADKASSPKTVFVLFVIVVR